MTLRTPCRFGVKKRLAVSSACRMRRLKEDTPTNRQTNRPVANDLCYHTATLNNNSDSDYDFKTESWKKYSKVRHLHYVLFYS
jgi:hypothetical protein